MESSFETEQVEPKSVAQSHGKQDVIFENKKPFWPGWDA